MVINEDFVVERAIQKLRTIVSSGQEHLVRLQGAPRVYLRQSELEEERVDEIFGESYEDQLGVKLPPEFWRNDAIRLGLRQDSIDKKTLNLDEIETWFSDCHDAALEHFSAEHFKDYRSLSEPPSPEIIKETNDGERYLQELQTAISERLRLLAESLADFGEHESIAPAVRDAQGGWPHLRGLLDDATLDDYLRRMRTRSIRPEISDAIGAAKEIVEATMKALAQRNDLSPESTKPELADWWKLLRSELTDPQIDRALGSRKGATVKLVNAEVTIVQSLGELRNALGTGHGRSTHPVGLKPEHALLAVDTAHMLTRFLTARV